jgi:calcineurin-like phosphoesterase family protein
MIDGLYDCFNHWHKNGTVHIISDTHFDDKELGEGVANRPDAETIVKMINNKVGRKDTLIILGDVGNVEYVKQLRGYKILIAGNHEAGMSNYKRQVITQMFSKDLYTKEQVLDLMKTMYPNCRYTIVEGHQFHSPFEFWKAFADNCLFDEIYTGPLMIAEKLILSHEPIPNLNWAMNIHGHIHNRHHKNDKYHFNVCCDAIGYLPINFNQWMKQGYLSNIEPLHRITIDKATKRSKGGRK